MNRFWRRLLPARIVLDIHRRRYDRQPSAEFLFERRSSVQLSADPRSPAAIPSNNQRVVLVAGGTPPHSASRRDDCVLRGSDVPDLTITSDPSRAIAVVGTTDPDWRLAFVARGEGQSEAEAQERVKAIAMTVKNGHVSLPGPHLLNGHQWQGELLVEGPAAAGIVVHGSYSSVEVFDFAGPVRIAATHARARIIDTSGQVDVVAGSIDFAGSSGHVTLTAEEINLKVTSRQFDGAVMAWAQRSVRVLVPSGSTTAITAVVSRRRHFVCRTDFASRVKYERQGQLHLFRYDNTNNPSGPHVHLRSEAAAVVIDNVALQQKPNESA